MRQTDVTKGFLAAAVIASLGVCVLAAAVPIEEKGLSVRAHGDVAVHFDQSDLVKRVSAALVASALTTLGGVTYAACQATAPISPAILASKSSTLSNMHLPTCVLPRPIVAHH